MRRSLKPLTVSILTIVALCDLAAPASASGHRTVKQGTGSSPALIVLPVISCKTTYGAGSSGEPFVARQLAASASAKGLSFYSNGLMTVLGPSGWTCEALVAADGGQKLDVFPAGSADYSQSIAPKGTSLVEVQGECTGHIPGADLVCALFSTLRRGLLCFFGRGIVSSDISRGEKKPADIGCRSVQRPAWHDRNRHRVRRVPHLDRCRGVSAAGFRRPLEREHLVTLVHAGKEDRPSLRANRDGFFDAKPAGLCASEVLISH